jgi:hypothetical protein
VLLGWRRTHLISGRTSCTALMRQSAEKTAYALLVVSRTGEKLHSQNPDPRALRARSGRRVGPAR